MARGRAAQPATYSETKVLNGASTASSKSFALDPKCRNIIGSVTDAARAISRVLVPA